MITTTPTHYSPAAFDAYKNSQEAESEKKNLKDEIGVMCQKDQECRTLWGQCDDPCNKEKFKAEAKVHDAKHLVRLKEIVEKHGWPGHSLVGVEASNQFWLLIQHVSDMEFKKLCLEKLQNAAANNDAAKEDLAYLVDRVRTETGHPQLYGTQFKDDLSLFPIEDEAHVDQRRLEANLPPLKVYLELIERMSKTERP